uniref:Uncharacterized protein LOC114347108 isoform X4 n=1 Tax=Diabrotica virgifera virgifera TaxID=50390 RepID=A0A6P7H537_DIAVI
MKLLGDKSLIKVVRNPMTLLDVVSTNAYGKVCNKGGKVNHFAVGCRVKKSQFNRSKQFNQRNVHEVEQSSDEDIVGMIEVGNVNTLQYNKKEKEWVETVLVNNEFLDIKLDCGAQCNVLPLDVVKKCNASKEIVNENHVLMSYGNNSLNVIGHVILRCVVRGKEYKIKFIVVNNVGKPLFGLNACKRLNLIKRVEEVQLQGSCTGNLKKQVY